MLTTFLQFAERAIKRRDKVATDAYLRLALSAANIAHDKHAIACVLRALNAARRLP